jgi:hypothetical protein
MAGRAFKKRDPCTAIGCNHRNALLPALLAVFFQVLPRPTKPDFASQFAKIVISLRCCQQLQPCSDGLSNAGSASFLSPLKQLIWDFHRNFSRRCHDELSYHTSYQCCIWPSGSERRKSQRPLFSQRTREIGHPDSLRDCETRATRQKASVSRLLDLYNHVNPDDEIHGDTDDPAETQARRPWPTPNLEDAHADCDKNFGTFGRVRDFVASTCFVWWLSGDAVDKFDLADQCHSRGSWICFNRERR